MMKIEQKIKMLPPDLQHEVEDFIEFLIERKKVNKHYIPTRYPDSFSTGIPKLFYSG